MHGHRGARFHVSNFVAAHGRVAVSVEELRSGGAVLGEVGVRVTSLPLLVVVNNVVGLWREVLLDSFIREEGVEHPDLVDGWLGALVSNAGVEGNSTGDQVHLPQERLVEHHEGEAHPGGEAAGPRVVGAVQTAADLVNVVGGTEAPLEVVVFEDVVRVLELGGVTVRLGWLVVGGVDVWGGLVVKVVVTLRGLVTHVVERWVSVLAESAHRCVGQHSLKSSSSVRMSRFGVGMRALTSTCKLDCCIIFNNYIIKLQFYQKWQITQKVV